jgi:hypothetical protein
VHVLITLFNTFLQLTAEGGASLGYVFHAMKSPILYGHGTADTTKFMILTDFVVGQIVAETDRVVNARLEEHHKDDGHKHEKH